MIPTKVRQGIILIPDFSGFTDFVFNTKIYTGEYIVKQLLTVLIDANQRYFYISEIEGDAILFYKYHKKPSYENVWNILQTMSEAFNEKLRELEVKFSTKIEMSLKFIVHYGSFSKYRIKDFDKLYGKPIIEAHQMLKNNVANYSSYILMSNSFLKATKNSKIIGIKENYLSEIGMLFYLDKSNKK